MADVEPLNGTAPESDEDQNIVITLRLRSGRAGLDLRVEAEPPGLYHDTVIDACLRAARFMERTALASEIVRTAQQSAQQAATLERNLGIIRGRG